MCARTASRTTTTIGSSPAASTSAATAGSIGSVAVTVVVGQPRSRNSSAMPHVTLKHAMLARRAALDDGERTGGKLAVDRDRPRGHVVRRRAGRGPRASSRSGRPSQHGDAVVGCDQMRRAATGASSSATHHSIDDGVRHRLVEVRAEAQEVGAGLQGANRGVGDPVDAATLGHRLHVECVGDDHAVEAHRLAEDARSTPR